MRQVAYRWLSTTLLFMGLRRWLGNDGRKELTRWSSSTKAGEPRGSTGSEGFGDVGYGATAVTAWSPEKCRALNRKLKVLTWARGI